MPARPAAASRSPDSRPPPTVRTLAPPRLANSQPGLRPRRAVHRSSGWQLGQLLEKDAQLPREPVAPRRPRVRVGLLPVGCQVPAETTPQQAIGAWAGMPASHGRSRVDRRLSFTACGCTGGLGAVSARPCVLSWECQLLTARGHSRRSATSGLGGMRVREYAGTVTPLWARLQGCRQCRPSRSPGCPDLKNGEPRASPHPPFRTRFAARSEHPCVARP